MHLDIFDRDVIIQPTVAEVIFLTLSSLLIISRMQSSFPGDFTPVVSGAGSAPTVGSARGVGSAVSGSGSGFDSGSGSGSDVASGSVVASGSAPVPVCVGKVPQLAAMSESDTGRADNVNIYDNKNN